MILNIDEQQAEIIIKALLNEIKELEMNIWLNDYKEKNQEGKKDNG